MQFDVGQNIVHPAHGAGTIVEVAQQELVEGYRNYYVVNFADKRLTVHVPCRRSQELGLRQVMSKGKCQSVLTTLAKTPQPLPKDHKERRKVIEQLVHSGHPLKVAEAIRELSWRQEKITLNNADSRLLSEARERLIREMALATNRDRFEIQHDIDRTLSDAMEARLSALEPATEH